MSPEHQRQNADDDSRQHGPVVQTRIDALIPRFYYLPDLFFYSHSHSLLNMLQSYEKSSTKQRNTFLFLSRRRISLVLCTFRSKNFANLLAKIGKKLLEADNQGKMVAEATLVVQAVEGAEGFHSSVFLVFLQQEGGIVNGGL